MKVYENLDLQDLENEIWKDINGYNGDYFISNLGRFKSLKFGKEKVLKQFKDGGEYFCIGLCKNGKVKYKKIHILMFEAFIEKIPKGYIIHHKDFTKDNRLDNFELMVREYHVRKHNEGKYLGENNPMFGKYHSEETKKLIRENNLNLILNEQKVIKIRKFCDEGNLTQKEIGKLFGVNRRTISDIKNKIIWKHI